MTIQDLKKGEVSLRTTIEIGEKILGEGSFIEAIPDKQIAIFFDAVNKQQVNIPYEDYTNVQYAEA